MNAQKEKILINENKLRKYIRDFLTQNMGIKLSPNNIAVEKIESIDKSKFYDLIRNIDDRIERSDSYRVGEGNKLRDKFKSQLAQNAFSESVEDMMRETSVNKYRDEFLKVVRKYYTLVYKDDGYFNANFYKAKDFIETLDKDMVNDCEEILKLLKL